MDSVALMLSSSTMYLPLPGDPAFHMDLTNQNLNEANSSVGSLSVNDISATEYILVDHGHIGGHGCGYMSPEYAMHGQYSIKSDVFSFGVLVLEIVSGQRNVCIQNGDNVEDLLILLWKNRREGTTASMVDPTLMNGAGKDTIPSNPFKPDVRINGKNRIPEKKDGNTTKQVYIRVAASVALAIIFIACIAIFVQESRPSYKITETAANTSDAEFLQYDFISIRAATNGFDKANKLGRGGFGNVYKGNLITGQEVAVKRLSKYSKQGEPQFKTEVSLVSKLKHRNLVKLLGFIAKGMLYLHEESGLKIIHCDLKASNVMLDENLNPKISDFGMARLIKQDDSGGSTLNIVGTYGYMAPEYAMQGKYSFKSDVFSFGVLVLEIVSGQRNGCVRKVKMNEEDLLTLVSKAWKNWQEGRALNMIDPVLTSSSCSVLDMVRCIHIGLLCVQEDPANRPSMASVALMLSSSTMTLPLPDEPAFHMDLTNQNLKEANSSAGSVSVNDISVTELYPR
ncbi:putative receptor-like protein kinase At4g00960 [Salvia splendens]|uniref:putative receptor-like protein kinase At4g00960 n=1 Tax=Salvia splendens TaxID=180675 RepID=UPI001C27FE22|nr:putative receptor-like protein kinase At4g00960 [Salvia splendens]